MCVAGISIKDHCVVAARVCAVNISLSWSRVVPCVPWSLCPGYRADCWAYCSSALLLKPDLLFGVSSSILVTVRYESQSVDNHFNWVSPHSLVAGEFAVGALGCMD